MKKNLRKIFLIVVLIFFILGIPTKTIAATNPTLKTTSGKILIGKSITISLKNKLDSAKYTWSTSNKSIATVNSKGKVTAKKKGTATITCKVTTGGKNFYLKYKLTAIQGAKSIKITNPIKSSYVGEIYNLKTKISSSTSNDIVSWSSSNKDIATIASNGKLILKKTGKVIIKAKTLSGKTASMTVKVLKIKYSGTVNKIKWTIDEEGMLIFNGEGDYIVNSGWRNNALSIYYYINEKKSFYCPWHMYSKEIKKVKINIKNQTYADCMFEGCEWIKSIDVSNWDTSKIKSMCTTFAGCSALTSIDASKLNMSNVECIDWMFYECRALKNINTSKWNTGKINTMIYAFYGCSSITKIDVSKWNTSNVKDMGFVFRECSKLETIDVSKWNTSNVERMTCMFEGCKKLKTINVGKWDTSNVEKMGCMFSECRVLKIIDVGKWNTSNVVELDRMFLNCSSLESIDVSKWDTSNVELIDRMFLNCSSLKSIDISKWDFSKLENADEMFGGCNSLKRLA